MSDAVRSGPLGALGRVVIAALHWLGTMGYLVQDTGAALFVGPLRGQPVRREAVAAQMMRVGVRAIPIVFVVVFFIGVIVAIQLAVIMKRFGVQEFIASVVGVATVRELGPLMTGIVLSGFAGASIAAELGTMKVGEEIDAMVSSALSPYRFLVAPRVLACVIMMPVLTVFANAMGILGGFVVSVGLLDISAELYIDRTIEAMDVKDVMTGLFKAGVFGAVIGFVSCLAGLEVRGGAAGVGRATTAAVVLGILSIIVSDCVFTAIFFYV